MSMTRISLSDIDGFVTDRLFDEKNDNTVSENSEIFRFVFGNLTDKQKCYIMMYYKMKMTMEEIAEKCGVSKSTVSRTVTRGRENILRGIGKEKLLKQLGNRK